MNPRLLLVLFALFGLIMTGAVAQHTSKSHKAKPKSSAKTRKLRDRLRHVEDQKRAVRSKLREAEHKVAAVSSDIDSVDAKLSEADFQLEATRALLVKDRAKHRRLERELATAEADLLKDRQSVRARIRATYMEGDAPAIGVVLGSSSSGDIASRTYLVDRVANADHRALDRYRSHRDDLAKATQEAIEVVERIKTSEALQTQQEAALQSARDEKSEVLASLQEKKGELQELLDQFESDENSIERQIAAASRVTGGSVPRHFGGRLSRPVNAPITSGFGMRYHPILHRTRLHAGIDFGAPTGTIIRAAADGVVVNAQYMRGFGNAIIINHGGGVATVYGHCSRLLVSAGEHVKRGQPIGRVGMTGLATGPHLHFEVHVGGHAVNPLGWL